jgi:hypothetical protein
VEDAVIVAFVVFKSFATCRYFAISGGAEEVIL